MSTLAVLATTLWLMLHYLENASSTIVDIPTAEDLTRNKTFETTSTCGLSGPVDFTLTDDTLEVCDSSVPSQSHPVRFLTDEDGPLGSRTWWQSANGDEQVTLTLDLDGFFFVQAIQIDFSTVTPSALVIEGSQDFGESFHPLRYFSHDCERDFERPDVALEGGGVRLDQLICTSNFIDGASTNFIQTMVLYNASSCSGCSHGNNYLVKHTLTNIRVRLVRYTGRLSIIDDPYLMSYYSIYNVDVPGLCVCGGNLVSPEIRDGKISCPCPIPLDRPFSCATPTSGPLCDSCLPGFYRSQLTNDECVPCECDQSGSVHSRCDVVTGECVCNPGSMGQRCESCRQGYIGPSPYLAYPCVRCFCNGYSSGPCQTEDGWYQARVESEFASVGGAIGFTTPGNLTYDTNGYLEVSSSDSSQLLTLSFPPSYLGDKRTSFGQSLTLNFSLPRITDPSLTVEGMVEIAPFISTASPPADRLRAKIDVEATPNEQQVRVVFSRAHTSFSLIPYFSGRGPTQLARDRDIRVALSNIVSLRLSFIFHKDIPSSARAIRLHHASLDYATKNSTHFAATPLAAVNYVESCTCPNSRTGSHCQSCNPTFTINPPYGGEFAHCVKCFCNFHSTQCDPVGGDCLGCTGNTRGDDCEDCLVGYVRPFPSSILQCDVCAVGFYDTGNGTCVACECDSEGSSSPSCASITGQCSCNLGVIGLKCDRCSQESTGSFPTCEVCDECTDQWLTRVITLRNLTQRAVSLVSGLNISEASVPELDGLFNLSRIVYDALHSNNAPELAIRINALHGSLCGLIDQMDDLIQRARTVNFDHSFLSGAVTRLQDNVRNLSAVFNDLQQETLEIAELLETVSLDSVNSSISSSISLAGAAYRRVSSAAGLIAGNFSSLLNDLRTLLIEYDLHRDYLMTRDFNITSRLDDARSDVATSAEVLRNVDTSVCGKVGSGPCGTCGGVGCGSCGSDEGCNGLSRDAANARNISDTALAAARLLLSNVQSDVARLNDLKGVAWNIVNDSADVLSDVRRAREEAELLLARVRGLLGVVESELNVSRVDPRNIGVAVNASLMLNLDMNPDEFLDVLVSINATIEMFFTMFMGNVSDNDLERRANEALLSAQRSRNTVNQIEANFTTLSSKYSTLKTEFNASTDLNSAIQESLQDGAAALDTVETSLTQTQSRIESFRSNLSGIRSRLSVVDALIQSNLRQLERAERSTAMAVDLSREVDANSTSLEARASDLEEESERKLDQSERDLAAAIDIRNRTDIVQQQALDQLLTLESLIRTEAILREDQIAVRGNIERVANEIEQLEQELQLHINRNTICMDPSTVTKRKRKRRRRRAI